MIERYFIVMSVGHSGSAWLAKVLNSHFDVMCFHELECIAYADDHAARPKDYFEFTPGDLLRNLLYIYAPSHRYGETYRVLGTVGGAFSVDGTLSVIEAQYPDAYRRSAFYLLLRNPVSQIHSAAAGNAGLWSARRHVPVESLCRWAGPLLRTLEAPLGGTLRALLEVGDLDLQAFLYASLGYLAVLGTARELRGRMAYDPVLRLEQLVEDGDALRARLAEITGLAYELPGQSVEKVNVKRGAPPPPTVFRSWPAEWQRLFWWMFEGRAHVLDELGYDLGKLTAPGPGQPALAAPTEPAHGALGLQVQWEAARRSLRESRAQLALANEELADLRARYERLAARGLPGLFVEGCVTRLRRLTRSHPRIFAPVRWAAAARRKAIIQKYRNAA